MTQIIFMERLAFPPKLAIDLKQVKDFLKIEYEVDDQLITSLIWSAMECCENYTGLVLTTQQWIVQVDHVNSHKIHLPLKPVKKVSKITIKYPHSIEKEYDKRHYSLEQNTILLHVPPLSEQLEILCECGYGNSPKDVPHLIKSILLEHIAHLYEYRGMKEPFDLTRYDLFKQLKI